MKKVIWAKELSKSYGDKKVLKDLNIQVNEGEIFGLLGHNGAGKSTTIECFLGLKKPTKGTIEILGRHPIKDRKVLFESVGVQLQESAYQHKIKVKEICELRASLYKNSVDYEQLLETLALAEKKNQLVSDLSGGERQKLSIVLTLIPNPKLIFLDELTTGLDAKARRGIWKYLKRLKEKGMTIFLTSHYMDEVSELCDSILILREGEMVAQGSVKMIIKNSPYGSLEEAYLWYTGEAEILDESI